MSYQRSLRTVSFIVAPIIIAAFFTGTVFAAPDRSELPDIEGTYAVSGRPHEKLRVHVYHPGKEKDAERFVSKAGKPAPTPTVVCGATSVVDPDSSAVTGVTGWHLPSHWSYALNVSSVPVTVGASKFSTIAANAFSSWTSASPDLAHAVVFSRAGDTVIARAARDNVNIITFGRTSSSALAVTYTWYDTTTGLATEIDTIFNKSFSWYWSDPASWPAGQTCAYSGVYDAEDILTHELGHTMGLDDEYDATFTHNTMYGYGAKGETKKDTVALGDILGLSSIY